MREQLARGWPEGAHFLSMDWRRVPYEWYEACVAPPFCELARHNEMEASAFAVYLANVLAARAALRARVGRLLVLEDDALFDGVRLRAQLDAALRQLPRDWQSFTFGCGAHHEHDLGRLVHAQLPCSRGYMVAGEGLRRLGGRPALPAKEPIDLAMTLSIFAPGTDRHSYHLSTTRLRHGSSLAGRVPLPRGTDFR